MAHTTHPSPSLLALAARAAGSLAALGRIVAKSILIAQNASSIAREVEALNAKTEDELTRLGKTRAGEVDRIFSAYAHL